MFEKIVLVLILVAVIILIVLRVSFWRNSDKGKIIFIGIVPSLLAIPMLIEGMVIAGIFLVLLGIVFACILQSLYNTKKSMSFRRNI